MLLCCLLFITFTPVNLSQQPSWKPALHKGKNQVYFTITEQIRAVQYDNASIADQWNLYGTVTCRAELEGVLPEITLNVTHVSDAPALPLDYLLTHPCVQSAEAQGLDPGQDTL